MFLRSKLTLFGFKGLSFAEAAIHAVSTISQLGSTALLANHVVAIDVNSKLVIEYIVKDEDLETSPMSTTLSYLKNDPIVGVKELIARDYQQSILAYESLNRGPASVAIRNPSSEIRNKPNDSSYSGPRYSNNKIDTTSNRNSKVITKERKSSSLQAKRNLESNEKSNLTKTLFARNNVQHLANSSIVNTIRRNGVAKPIGGSRQSPITDEETIPPPEIPIDPIISGPILTDLSQRDVARAMTQASDGSIYIGGDLGPSQKDLFLVKYKPNGNIDGSFGSEVGFVTTSIGNQARGYTLITQTDHKILLGGSAFIPGNQDDLVVVRYLTDGSLDLSWGGTGLVTNDYQGRQDELLAMQLQDDGKLVATGYVGTSGAVKEHLAVIRFNVDGSLDSTFGGTGLAVFNLGGNSRGTSIVIQSDGKIIVGGYVKVGTQHNGVVTRINANGTMDSSYATGGLFTLDLGSDEKINSIKLTSSGKIVFAGSVINANQDLLIGKINPSGTLEASFADFGLLILDLQTKDDDATTLIVNDDETIYIGGTSKSLGSDSFIVKLLSNGSFDSSFSSSGLLIKDIKEDDSISALGISSDGGLIISGTSVFSGASGSDLFLFKIP